MKRPANNARPADLMESKHSERSRSKCIYRAVAPVARARRLRSGAGVRCGRRRLGFRAHGRLWRLVGQARPLARIAPSQARDATPAALPRSHRRRLLPPLPPALPLRPRPPHRTQPLDPRGRAPPVFHGGPATDRLRADGDWSARCPLGTGPSEGFAVPRPSMNGQTDLLRAKVIASGGVGLAATRPGKVTPNSDRLVLPDGGRTAAR